MRPLFTSLSILIGILGLIFILRGCFHPTKYKQELKQETTTAVRVTQVYTEATHTTVVGIGIVGFGILVALIGTFIRPDEWKNLYLRITRKTDADSTVPEDTETLEGEENTD